MSVRVLVKGIRIIGLPSPWLEDHSPIVKALYYFIDVYLTAISIYMSCIYLYTIFKTDVSFQDLCSLGLGFSSFQCGILVFIYHLLHQRRLKGVTDNFDSFSKLIRQLGQEDLFHALHVEKSRMIPTLTKLLIYTPFLTIFFYVIPVPVSDLITGTYRSRHPLPFQSPFDDKRPGIYEVLLFLEAFCVSSSSRKNATDCLFMAIFKSHSAVLQYLSAVLDDIQKDFALGDDEEGRRKLVLWLELHQNIITNIQELLSVFSPMFVINYLNIVGVVVCGLFVQIKKDGDSIVQSLGIGFFVFLVIVQLFLLTNAAEEFISEAQKLALKAYNLPWYNMKKNEKDILRLIIMMSNRPIQITAYKTLIFLMNRETFAGFLFSSLSAFVTLCQMEDRFS